MSGDVDDKLMHSIGKQFGADIIITGSLTQQGSEYRMQVRAINVETAQIHGLSSQMVQMDSILASFTHRAWVDPDAWKHKKFFLGVRGGSSVGFYNLSGIMSDGNIEKRGTFDIALQAAYQINEYFAVQTELMYSFESVKIPFVQNLNYQGWFKGEAEGLIEYSSLLIPILAKYTYRPVNFSIQGFAGPYFSMPIGKLREKVDYASSFSNYFSYETLNDFTVPIGIMVGGSFGINVGPGSIFVDIRYANEFGNIETPKGKEQAGSPGAPRSNELFQKSRIIFSIGYEIGLINR
jgi:hypothetical protein